MILSLRLPVLLVLLWAFAKTSHAQVLSPLSTSIAESGVAHLEVWGAGENPASYGNGDGFRAQAYGFTQTQISGLDRFGLDIALGKDAQSFGGSLQFYDAPGYNLTSIHLGGARRLGENLHAGLRVGAVLGNFEVYGSELLPIAQAGIQYHIIGKVSAGAHYTYIERPILPLAEHRLRIGLEYKSSPRVTLLLATWQAVDQSLAGGLGVVYQAADNFILRGGVQTGSTAFTFGLETKIGNQLALSVGCLAYQVLPLGVTYGIFYR